MYDGAARYLRDGRQRSAARGTGAGHREHSIDELRRQAARAGSQRRGHAREPASAAGLAAGARRTWPLRYQSIDARRRRGRVAGAAHSCRANS